MVKKKSEPLSQETPPPKKKYNYTKPTGQPTKYKPEYCEMLINHMAEGLSFESFAGLISVNYDTLYEWNKVQPDFSEAKKAGNAKRRIYDEQLFNDYLKGNKTCSPAAIIFKMKSVHKQTDDVIGLRKLKMLQLDTMSPEQIKELAVKLLKD